MPSVRHVAKLKHVIRWFANRWGGAVGMSGYVRLIGFRWRSGWRPRGEAWRVAVLRVGTKPHHLASQRTGCAVR